MPLLVGFRATAWESIHDVAAVAGHSGRLAEVESLIVVGSASAISAAAEGSGAVIALLLRYSTSSAI